MVSSIHRFARELGASHVVKGHVEKRRTQILDQSTTDEREYHELKAQNSLESPIPIHPAISSPFDRHAMRRTIDLEKGPQPELRGHHGSSRRKHARGRMQRLKRIRSRQPKMQLLKEEKDRFEAMRQIQHSTQRFKRYSALTMSVCACESAITSRLCLGLTDHSWSLVVCGCDWFLESRGQEPASVLFPSSLLLLCFIAHDRLWRSFSKV